MTCVSYTNTYTISNRLNTSEIQYEKGGTVYVWGNRYAGGATNYGGSFGQIKGLQDVVYIYTFDYGYAALLKDTSVYIWGGSDYIGPQGFLSINGEKVFGVKTIRCSSQAFAAVLTDGNVILWGISNYGASTTPSITPAFTFCPPMIIPSLTNIEKIYSTSMAFVAVDNTGSVWVWGDPLYGAIGNGDIYNIPGLQNVIDITCNNFAFAALLSDETVYVWGATQSGGKISPSENVRGIVTGLTNVKKVYKTEAAFAALRNDGTVFIWGSTSAGGSLDDSISYVNLPISGATNIYSTIGAFTAQLDNQVYIWGNPGMGGNLLYNGSYNPMYIPNIINVCGNGQAFAGITTDGKIFVWGHPDRGGSNVYNDPTKYGIVEISNNTISIVAGINTFSGLTSSGQVIIWGEKTVIGTNGNPSYIEGLEDIQKIFTNNGSYCGVDINNNVNVWGTPIYGGDKTQITGLTNFGAIFPNVYAGAYAVLQIEPDDTTSNVSPTLAGFVGLILGLFIFISFYFISRLESSNTRYTLFLLSILISVGAVVLVSLL